MRTSIALETWRGLGRRALRLREMRVLLGLRSDNTAYKRAERLAASGLIRRVAKGVYELASGPASDFELANLLRSPSYVSLESALSLHGLLSQAPRRVTSVSTRPTRRLAAAGKDFEYARIKPGYFFGYEQRDGALVATPEKALADLLYLASKGLRRVAVAELDLSGLDRGRFRAAVARMRTPPFQRYLREAGL